MVAGELTHFAGEVYPAIGQQNPGLANELVHPMDP
jgi:hypothetical protein